MLEGEVIRVSGPVVHAGGMRGSRMYDVVRVGDGALTGEVIRLDQEVAVIQVYEDTTGLKTGEVVENTGEPLRVELGPGLLASIFDGVQRPLPLLVKKSGDFISRGITVSALDHERRWEFEPSVQVGAVVGPGDVLGTVREFNLDHRVMVPPDLHGTVEEVAEGALTVDDAVVRLDGDRPVRMSQAWPVRKGRPYGRKLDPTIPLLTGQRIFDTLFPIAKGGTAMIPGGFGTGKTVSEQTLARWSDAHVVVYIGCGERGNEMTDVLTEFPELLDPRTGRPLLERTIMIANTSNMPVAAREASIYTGITMAEYYRDQGYDVALLADSTSRWGEALREVSGRLEEMPGEEGYPAYLAARLAAFYERAGRTACLGADKRTGSITVVGAVSPPGGDFSEPITQNTLRIVGTFWALDTNLAYRRHFPSVSWIKSYSLYLESLRDWFTTSVSSDWGRMRDRTMFLLQKEAELQEIVQLVGPDALPESEKAILEITRMVREDFLQQSAYSASDAYCPIVKQFMMLKAILSFYDAAVAAMGRGIPLRHVLALPQKNEIARMKEQLDAAAIGDLIGSIEAAASTLEAER